MNAATLKAYYSLAKPGIIRGNLITAIAGFLLGARGHITLRSLIALAVGISLVIASGCVCNNYLDQAIDKKMKRTKKRALVAGTISPAHALVYAGILGALGVIILALFTNWLTTGLALIGLFFYVVLYTPLKPRSVHATLVGSVAGAVPIVAGYCAATNRFDLGALLLFLVLVMWQMPHFYAIAIYRYYDYFGAGLPVLPVKNGIAYTKKVMVLYILGFFIASSLLFVFGYGGYVYLLVMFLLCFGWVLVAVHGFTAKNDAVWARGVFRFSLGMLLFFSIMISVNHLLV
jgi:protoheme IX farnesyltransferase